MHRFTVALGLAALGLTAGQAMAQMSPADKTFATKAAQGGQAEVVLGQLATANAGTPQVRTFGQRMVTDHTQANQALLEIGRQQNLSLPTSLKESDRTLEQRLHGLKGQAFDAAYMKDMVQDHRQDVADFQKEATEGKDPALRAFAQKYLPVLKEHLTMAESSAPRAVTTSD